MSYQALYRKWRPEYFRDFVGQERIITTLINQITSGRIAHAYLFCGSRGTGKTSTAKVLARAINCLEPENGEPCGRCAACVQLAGENNLDIVEIDAASNNGVDEIRDLRDKVKYPPTVGRYKVYIIDEVHMLSAGAFNALLKTLEEPPAHAVFILATTEPQRLPATILSRCQRFDFKRIPARLIEKRLRQVLDSMDAGAEDEAVSLVARAAEGGMRDALSILDMCLSYGEGRLTAALVREVLGASDRAFLFDFAQALIDGEAARAVEMIGEVMLGGRDPAVFAREVTGHVRGLLVARTCEDGLEDLLEITREDAERMKAQASQASQPRLMRLMELFIQAENDMKWSSQQRIVLELCAVRGCHPEREQGEEALEDRLAALERAMAEGVRPAAAAQAPAGEA
ncbi:MAG: DNA polymerase III subunit gamma/tau, partial [Clostridia bacterium]|nr:DNA polymerase III subunit gamma/tau [Clostridia bacterium]